MDRRTTCLLLLGATFIVGTAHGQDRREPDAKLLQKVKDAVQAQKEHPKPKGDLVKTVNTKLHALELQVDVALKVEAKVEAKAGDHRGAGVKKAQGAAASLATTMKHLKSKESNAGQTKDAHKKKSTENVKHAVEAHKNKPQAKDDLKKQEGATLLAIEAKLEIVVKIDVTIDAHAEREHKGDAVKKVDSECNKLKALHHRIHAAELDDALWAQNLADRAWIEALVKELDADIDAMWGLIHDLDSIGFHLEADELEFACDELEDLIEDLAEEWLLLHLDEFSAAEIEAFIIWVADLDAWHESDARSWEQDLEDTSWVQALCEEIHNELDELEADLLALADDLHDIAVEAERACEACEALLFDVGVEWIGLHQSEWDEHQIVEIEIWVVHLED